MMLRKPKSVNPGNVYVIKTAIGYGLFQCVAMDEPGIDVIRVLQPILSSIEDFQPQMVEGKERYYTKMVVGEAERRKLITLVGSYPLPHHAKAPTKYRDLSYVPHRNVRNWYEVDAKTLKMKLVTELTDEFLALSGSGIWNDTYLRERLEEGWSLENWK